MTKDFRHIGRTSADSMAESVGEKTAAAAPAMPPASQRLILMVVLLMALGFFAAGVWLLSGGRSPLPADQSGFLGIAFVISAIADVGIVFFLKRLWSRPRA